MLKTVTNVLVVMTALLVGGCSTPMPTRDPAYAAVRPQPIPVESHSGAIFDSRNNVALFSDYRATHVGDILTVVLNEKTDGQKESETDVKKDNSNDIKNPTLFGATPQFSLPGYFPLTSTHNNNLAFSAGSKSNFKGSGDSDQSNKLTGNISVSVVEVLPNGNLVIRGEKIITINQGNEYVRLSGIINPRDVGPDNSVSSVRIADAQISYVGEGATNDANQMGWLSRFFTSSFMPF